MSDGGQLSQGSLHDYNSDGVVGTRDGRDDTRSRWEGQEGREARVQGSKSPLLRKKGGGWGAREQGNMSPLLRSQSPLRRSHARDGAGSRDRDGLGSRDGSGFAHEGAATGAAFRRTTMQGMQGSVALGQDQGGGEGWRDRDGGIQAEGGGVWEEDGDWEEREEEEARCVQASVVQSSGLNVVILTLCNRSQDRLHLQPTSSLNLAVSVGSPPDLSALLLGQLRQVSQRVREQTLMQNRAAETAAAADKATPVDTPATALPRPHALAVAAALAALASAAAAAALAVAAALP